MKTPDRKVQAGGVAGMLATVLVWSMDHAGVPMPADVAVAVATLLIMLVSYFVPNKVEA